MLRSAALVSFP